MQLNVKNFTLTDLGHEVFAEADFLEHHIKVQCVYDSQHQSWIYHVFLIDDTGLQRITEVPCVRYSSSRLGAVHRGIVFAKRTIQASKRSSSISDTTRRPTAFETVAQGFKFGVSDTQSLKVVRL